MVSATTGGNEDVEGTMNQGRKDRYAPIFFSSLSSVTLFLVGLEGRGCGFGERGLLKVGDSSKSGFGKKAGEGWVLMVRQM